jgi:predicted RNase H-like HicB family nuclease
MNHARQRLTLTFLYEPSSCGGFKGYAAELPGPFAEGATTDEVRRLLKEQVGEFLAINVELGLRDLGDDARVERVSVTVARRRDVPLNKWRIDVEKLRRLVHYVYRQERTYHLASDDRTLKKDRLNEKNSAVCP